jgi:hypothetical protein
MSEENQKSKTLSALIGVGMAIVALATFAMSIQWGYENVVKWVTIPIILGVVIFATRRFWIFVFSNFQNIKTFTVVVGLISLLLYLFILGGKLLNIIFLDRTPVSPTVFAVLVIGAAPFSVRLFSAEFSHRQSSLFLIVYAAGYSLLIDFNLWIVESRWGQLVAGGG